VRARHILGSTREEADEVARLLAEGEDFATLAAQVSQDPATRFEGGDLGYFTREGILPGFAGVAFETPVGSISAPFQTEFGWHVLTVVDRRNQARPSLDEMRPRIVRFLTLDGIQTLLDTIRETYPVTRSAAPAPAELRAQETEETGRGAENDTDSSGGER
jgi:peptidyl-prolyl cis-trans isomerase C